MVAAALRTSTDPEVLALFGWSAPISKCEALDLFTEVTSPGAHARVLARGWPVEDA
jgi:hypothetical protein